MPAEYVSQDTPVCSLWEELSGYFHKAFDYGAGLDARVRLVSRGPFGLDGALRFLDYFIRERGLEGGPVELKLEQLIDAVNSVYVHLRHQIVITHCVTELPLCPHVHHVLSLKRFLTKTVSFHLIRICSSHLASQTYVPESAFRLMAPFLLVTSRLS